MWEWIINNKEWAFSGIGVTIILALFGVLKFIFKHKKKNSATILRQENTHHSNGVQIGVQNNYGGKDNE